MHDLLTTVSQGVVRRLPVESALLWAALRVLLLLAAFYTAYKGILLLEGRLHISQGIVYLVVATAMLVVAAWRHPLTAVSHNEPPPAAGLAHQQPGRWAPARRWATSWPALAWWGLLLSAIGLGFAFRLYQIDSLPFGVWFDEAQNGIVARRILDESSYRPVFVGGLTQLPALFFYFFAAAIKFIGHGVLALRSVTTAAGILSLFFIYLLARELFDQRVAVLATFFLAVMHWHVNFSRFAMHGIFAPLFMAATFYFLARGLKGKGVWNFLAAGVMAGVGLQGYFSFLLVPFIIVPYLLHHVAFQRVLPWRKLVLGVAAFGVVTAAVYAPVGIWALRNLDQFNQRAETLTVTKDRSAGEVADVVWQSTRQHLLMFNSAGDRNGRHNLPGAPMLDTYTGFLFVLGVGYALWRWRSSGHFLLLVWVVVTLQGGIWSVEFEAPQAYRTVGLTPAIAMLAALPLGLLWRLAMERTEGPEAVPRQWSTRFGYYALGSAAALVTLFTLAQAGRLNFETYFQQQLKRADVSAAYSVDVTLVAKEMERLGTDYDYWLSTLLVGHPSLEFLYPQVKDLGQYRLDPTRDLPLGESRPTAIFLDITKEPYFRWLRSLYPEADFIEMKPPGTGQPTVVYEVLVPPESIDRLRGLEASYRPQEGAVLQRRESAIDFDWTSEPPVEIPFEARWSGILKVSEYGEHTLVAEAPGSLLVRLDGKLLGQGAGRVEATRTLFRGEHRLEVEASIERPGRVALSDNGQLVPASAYFSVPTGGRGLLASFYKNDSWSGEPVLQQLDPFVGFRYHADLPFGSPFSAAWRGQLEAPTTGSYLLEVQAVDEAAVTIDGSEVMQISGQGQQAVLLTAGPHDVEVRFRNRGGYAQIYFYWTPPDGEREVIPTEYLSPP